PPFRYRSTGERSVRSAPPPPFGVLPRFATAPRGRDPFAPRPLPPSGYSPVSLPLHGGEIRSLRAPSPLRGTPPFRYRSTGERSVRSAPPPPFGVLPRFATAPRGRDSFALRCSGGRLRLHERHQLAQLGTHLLDLMGPVGGTLLVEERRPLAGLGHPLVGEGTRLDLAEDLLHRLAGLVGDDPAAPGVVPVLSGVGHRVPHPRKTTLVEKVDDELELVERLEVRRLGLIARFDEGLERGLDQLGDTAAEDDLLTEQVGLGLLPEGGLEDPGPGAADPSRVGERKVLDRSRGILVDGDETRDTGAFGEGASHQMPRALRGHHGDVDVGGWLDEAEVDVEAV